MIQLKNILVAFDGSKHGLKALEAAKILTQNNDAQLTVIYVHDYPFHHPISISTTNTGDEYLYMEPGPLINDAPIVPVEEKTVILEEIPYQVISIAKSKLDDLKLVTYERLFGKPAEEIVNYASKNNIDLIIVGNRGISGFEKFVVGSVSKKVTKDSECSVFIVK